MDLESEQNLEHRLLIKLYIYSTLSVPQVYLFERYPDGVSRQEKNIKSYGP